MRKMFLLLATSVSLLFLISCGNQESKFTSLVDEPVTNEIESLVSEEEKGEEKIGRAKKKNGEKVDVTENVGKKDFEEKVPVTQDLEEEVSVTFDLEVNKAVEDLKEASPRKPATVRTASKESPKAKADVLFYLTPAFAGNRSTSACWSGINKSAKKYGFLKNLKSVDWQVGISMFSEEGAQLAEWERRSSKFTLREGDTTEPLDFNLFAKKVHGPTTILSKELHDTEVGHEVFTNSFLHEFKKDAREYDLTSTGDLYVEDTISGLDQLLSENADGLFRKNAKTYVFMIDNNYFPYYTTSEWKKFFKKHKNLELVVISPRTVKVANIHHVTKKFDQVTWMPMCDDPSGLFPELAKIVTEGK